MKAKDQAPQPPLRQAPRDKRMATPQYYTRFNLTKAEIACFGIVVLTLLYVVGIILYNHSTPRQTVTFKIQSKRFVEEEKSWLPFSRSGRYGVFRAYSTFVPAHYAVEILWGETPFTLHVPLAESQLVQGGEITFTYRILKNGRLQVVDYLDTHAQADSVEIDEFGIFEIPEDDRSQSVNPRLVSQTDQIPAESGIAFGYTFTVTGQPRGNLIGLQLEYSYPGLVPPGSSKMLYRETIGQPLEIGPNNSIWYVLGDEWELVPGKWSFAVKDGDRVLSQKDFVLSTR